MQESARISRGQIKEISELKFEEYDVDKFFNLKIFIKIGFIYSRWIRRS